MNFDEIDIEVNCVAVIKSKEPLTTAEQIELAQEEVRINYYLHKLGEKIERALKAGKKIDTKFLQED